MLRDRGISTYTVQDLGLVGEDDTPLLEVAAKKKLVLITQDRDFGRLAFLHGLPYFGVIFLRPGTLDADSILRNLLALNQQDVEPPFFLVVRRDTDGSIRVRSV